eukprot:TRINITY_DN50010_c0_g1_i1.p1 TRINITY_DN50010_c0_g1~~TRINITY_DN50010_c0_g1_i1.p1  ORF type:complete len:1034 (+),score=467.34 TRINITY_DN50010_c0_g1_i1:132-3104(+)
MSEPVPAPGSPKSEAGDAASPRGAEASPSPRRQGSPHKKKQKAPKKPPEVLLREAKQRAEREAQEREKARLKAAAEALRMPFLPSEPVRKKSPKKRKAPEPQPPADEPLEPQVSHILREQEQKAAQLAKKARKDGPTVAAAEGADPELAMRMAKQKAEQEAARREHQRLAAAEAEARRQDIEVKMTRQELEARKNAQRMFRDKERLEAAHREMIRQEKQRERDEQERVRRAQKEEAAMRRQEDEFRRKEEEEGKRLIEERRKKKEELRKRAEARRKQQEAERNDPERQRQIAEKAARAEAIRQAKIAEQLRLDDELRAKEGRSPRKDPNAPVEIVKEPQTLEEKVKAAEQARQIAEVSKETGLNREYAQLCLEAANWDHSKALELFEERRESLPEDAYAPQGEQQDGEIDLTAGEASPQKKAPAPPPPSALDRVLDPDEARVRRLFEASRGVGAWTPRIAACCGCACMVTEEDPGNGLVRLQFDDGYDAWFPALAMAAGKMGGGGVMAVASLKERKAEEEVKKRVAEAESLKAQLEKLQDELDTQKKREKALQTRQTLLITKFNGQVGVHYIGQRVEAVREHGPAYRAGLRQGHIIVSVNQKTVESEEEIGAAFDAAPASEPFTVIVEDPAAAPVDVQPLMLTQHALAGGQGALVASSGGAGGQLAVQSVAGTRCHIISDPIALKKMWQGTPTLPPWDRVRAKVCGKPCTVVEEDPSDGTVKIRLDNDEFAWFPRAAVPGLRTAKANQAKPTEEQQEEMLELREKVAELETKLAKKKSTPSMFAGVAPPALPTWATKGQGGLRNFMDAPSGRAIGNELRNQQKALVQLLTTVGSSPRGEICRQFMQGRCTRGTECRYSHGMENLGIAGRGSAPPSSAGERAGNGVCRDFLRGDCTRGDGCRYSHSQTEEPSGGRSNSWDDMMRPDPADGHLRSKREFVDKYGGFAEWDAAEGGHTQDSKEMRKAKAQGRRNVHWCGMQLGKRTEQFSDSD